MKYIIITAVIVLGLVGALIYRAATTSPSNTGKQLAENTVIIDVRTPEEFIGSHVANATLFPIEDMQTGKMPELAKDTPIALYCRSGNRAGQAVKLMQDAGFTNVISLGGLDDVEQYGLRLTSS